ncbi:glycoside hydrolase [Burkholderia orbicola]|uniref:glycoside hydrolase n=1 Tax=Burkholderia orbicola TaxID=2978683 RepID=UPI00264D56C1|nr:glycoside hydrolase [Burkholderia orbicola]MDN7533867.1 glycoside hydrolase [Burkholderia orbicola]
MARTDAAAAGGTNRVAFLDAIAFNELGPLLLRNSDDGYDLFGNSTPSRPRFFKARTMPYGAFPDADDPAMPIVTAGRYRIAESAWETYRVATANATFDPLTQDRWALDQLAACGATEAIDAGQFTQALRVAASVWVRLSVPSADRDDRMLAAYKSAGGEVSETTA